MSKGSELVIRTDHDGLTKLTLNRPEKLNALNEAMFEELYAHVVDLAGDARIECVVLRGSGRSFCAGHDLNTIAHDDSGDDGTSVQAQVLDLLERLPMPTIAQIHGHCFTGGLELALTCDLIVASVSALLGDTHGQWGLVPVWGMSVRLPERVGPAVAKRMMFTSVRISGDEAERIGLVDLCAPDAELESAVANLAAAIMRNSRGTNRIVKRLLADREPAGRSAALAHERAIPYGLPQDMAERMSAR